MRKESRRHVVKNRQGKAKGFLPTEKGFSLVELLIAMVMFVLTIAAASQIFTGLVTQFKQQSKIAETNIEGAIGLEILRQDLEHAGYGLPWNGLVAYNEPVPFNDSPNAPRAIVSDDGTEMNGSDYLVIKAINVARNDASRKSTRLITTAPYVRTWDPVAENPAGTDRVIVISSGNDTTQNTLVTNGGTFYTTYGTDGANLKTAPWLPTDPTDPAANRIVYGIDPADTNPLRMPFNRADYYISTPADFPSRCATGTGVLYKGTVNHGNGELTELPLLDCVADMQVDYGMDTNADGIIGTQSNANGSYVDAEIGANVTTVQATLANASLLRQQIKEVRVYILAHEGQRDPNFTFTNFTGACATCVTVGRSTDLGQDFDLTAITNYLNYRWKIYTIVVKPENLRGE